MRHYFDRLKHTGMIKLWGGVVCVLCVVGLAACVPVKPVGQVSAAQAYDAIESRLTPSFE